MVSINVIDDNDQIIGQVHITNAQFDVAKQQKFLQIIQKVDSVRMFDPIMTSVNATIHSVTLQCYYNKDTIVFKCVGGDLSNLHSSQYTPK